MLSNWLNQFGDWNPQLWRELKSRLKTRNIVMAATVSLFGQFLIFNYFQRQVAEPTFYGEPWQFQMFHLLTWIGQMLLLILGCYLLVRNIATEEKQGTFILLRLSPQSASKVLLGKLIGVPILLYWTIALAVPLHLWAAMGAEIELEDLVAVYLMSIAACLFAYGFALVYVLGWGAKAQAWYAVVLAFFLVQLFLAIWQTWSYFGHLRDRSLFFYCSVALLLLFGGAAARFWQMALDRFRQPPPLPPLSNPKLHPH